MGYGPVNQFAVKNIYPPSTEWVSRWPLFLSATHGERTADFEVIHYEEIDKGIDALKKMATKLLIIWCR